MMRWLGRQRFLFNAGNSLVGNLIIVYLGADKLQEKLIAYWSLSISVLWIVPIFLCGMWIVGWAWLRFGGFAAEAEIGWAAVPQVKQMLSGINRGVTTAANHIEQTPRCPETTKMENAQ